MAVPKSSTTKSTVHRRCQARQVNKHNHIHSPIGSGFFFCCCCCCSGWGVCFNDKWIFCGWLSIRTLVFFLSCLSDENIFHLLMVFSVLEVSWFIQLLEKFCENDVYLCNGRVEKRLIWKVCLWDSNGSWWIRKIVFKSLVIDIMSIRKYHRNNTLFCTEFQVFSKF